MGDNIGRIRHLIDYESVLERGASLQWAIQSCKLIEADVPVNLRTNVGLDIASAGVLGFNQGGAGVTIGGAWAGTASATSATTITVPVNLPVNSIVGQLVVTTSGANRFGIAQSNTSVASSVITVDGWYDANALPADPGVAFASTPTAGATVIVPGNAPCTYMALANNATAVAPAVTDTALTGEIVTASGGLIRKLGTYAHSASSAGSSTVTLTKTWTANGSDSLPVTVSQQATFQGVVVAASRMFTKTALSANATLTTSGDQVQDTTTYTVT
jgi:hypothetical protein